MDDPLITELYAAMVQPEGIATVLDKLSQQFKAQSAFMFSSHSAVQPDAVLLGHRMAPETMDEFGRYWYQEDLWALAAGRRYMMRRDVVLLSEELMSTHDYQHSRYYVDFARPAGISRMLGSVLFDGSERDGALPFTNLCWYRPHGHDAFTREHKRRLVSLLPHLQTAFALRHKLQQASLRGAGPSYRWRPRHRHLPAQPRRPHPRPQCTRR